MVREGRVPFGPLSALPVSHLDRQTGSSVLQIHHSHRHSGDGAQDPSQRSGLSGEQPAEHWREPAEACLGAIPTEQFPRTVQGHGVVLLAQKPTACLTLTGAGEGGYPIT